MLDNGIIDSVVDLILQNKITFSSLYTNSVISQKVTNEPLVDKTRELQSLLTDFVVNEFFPSSVETEQFIKLVYGTFDIALKVYKRKMNIDDNDIFFAYKGGNILRYVVYELMHEIGGKVSDDIEMYYKDVFKKSDADFSIYINPTLQNYDIIFNDMNMLAYLLQDRIRDEFMGNLPKYFYFHKLDNTLKQQILQQYLEKLNNTATIKNKLYGYDGIFTALVLDDVTAAIDNSKITYVRDPDFEMNFRPRDLRIIDKTTLKSSPGMTSMRITSNQTLEFVKTNNNVKFSLVRTKIVFNAYFTNSRNNSTNLAMLGGELIDVSIPHKNDSNIGHYFQHLNNNVATYNIKSSVNSLSFKAPSLSYLIEDIEKILFVYQEYPWEDTKYAKRLRRVLFMYFCALLVNPKLDYNFKIKYLQYIKNNIFEKLTNMISSNDLNFSEVEISIGNFLDNCDPNRPDLFPFSVLLDHLKKLLKKQYDMQKFQEYCVTIYDNIILLISLFDGMMQRCNNTGLKAETIFEGHNLWGGNKSDKIKYYKYKAKYLKSKSRKH